MAQEADVCCVPLGGSHSDAVKTAGKGQGWARARGASSLSHCEVSLERTQLSPRGGEAGVMAVVVMWAIQ